MAHAGRSGSTPRPRASAGSLTTGSARDRPSTSSRTGLVERLAVGDQARPRISAHLIAGRQRRVLSPRPRRPVAELLLVREGGPARLVAALVADRQQLPVK